MTKAYILMNGKHEPGMTKKYTPDGSDRWEDLDFVVDPKDADYLVVINQPPQNMPSFPPEKILYYRIEPSAHTFTQYYWVNASPNSHFYPNKNNPFIIFLWKIDKTWTELKNMEPPEKTHDLCWITSNIGDGTQPDNIEILDGHRKRMKFLERFITKYPYDFMWHLYGRGFTPLGRNNSAYQGPCKKWDVIKHHRYCLCFESSCESGYATEKIFDAIMAFTFPIYWGCPNLEDLLPEKSFIRLDIEDDNAIDEAMEIAHSDHAGQHLFDLKMARDLILDRYTLGPRIQSDINNIING